MKLFWRDIGSGLTMGLVVPGLILNFAAAYLPKDIPSSDKEEIQSITATGYISIKPKSNMTMLLNTGEEQPVSQIMDEYLVGVLLAEMPPWFDLEALKAQAVVARTYTVKAKQTGGKHGDGSVCMQSVCCQAYTEPNDFLKAGGTAADLEKIRSAVADTSGMVLCYQGEPIEATYFSCSGGKTEDAAAVWGTDYPYLRSVNSPGEEGAAHYTDTYYFSKDAFAEALGISMEGEIKDWLGTATYTAGNGIAQMNIGGKSFTGTELRNLLNLRSTVITLQPEGEGITITTMGYGHRVGMSQYGADAMAASGSTYQEILLHYYPETKLMAWDIPAEED